MVPPKVHLCVNRNEEYHTLRCNLRFHEISEVVDFGVEVPHSKVEFLTARGFEILGEYGDRINRDLCLQRFWKKI